MATVHEANGEQVRAFDEAVHAAAGINQITDAVIAIATSDAWQDYILDGHGAAWLAAEFDYFLIACGVRYADMVEVLKGRSDAQLLAPLMDQKADAHRPLKNASAEWDSPLEGVTLIALARELGWVTARGRARKPPAGRRAPPVGRRARARADDGMSREQRAMQARRRRIGEARCAELEQLAASVVDYTRNWDERRFVADEILHDR